VVTENSFSLSLGNRIACERFVREQYSDLYRWFVWLTNCPHRAADLTQSTFAAFWESLSRPAPEASPRTWLFAIGRNQWRKELRDHKSHSNGDAENEDPLNEVCDDALSPQEILEHREFAAALESEVAALAPDFREALVLRLWQDFAYDEIATVQGITPELARWRFFRARQLLRARLKAFCLQEDGHAQ
jgi:RNA polymerase sigma-70 factor (ECF subfamily)